MATAKKINYPIYSLEGDIKYKKEIFLHISPSKGIYIIHRALIRQLNQKRKGNAHCKSRSDVNGGGKKPWKQKGTGKARIGSIRSPLLRGGGVIFGPKTKKHNKKINKKEQQLALKTLLYNKAHKTIVVDKFNSEIEKPRTKTLIEKLHKLNINTQAYILIITLNISQNLYLSARNLGNVQIKNINQINMFNLLQANTIIIESEALDKIEKVYNK